MDSMMQRNFAGLSGAVLLAAALAQGQTDPVNALTAYETAQGFELMFDGTNASSFRNRFKNYQKSNTDTAGTLHSGWTVSSTQLDDPDLPGVAFGAIINGSANVDMRSKKLYRDFDWRFEYRNSGNQGVIYRFDVSGSYAWETGIEVAIDNNLSQTNEKFEAGAAYDLIASSPQTYQLRSTNKWNSIRIVAKGDSVEHWMNGVKVVGFKYWSAAFLAAYQNSKWTGYNRYCQTAPNNRIYIPEGYIGLQGDHGGAWQLRRMRILHDSSSAQNRVKLGAIDTVGTSLRSGGALRGSDLRLRSAPGLLYVSSGEPVRSIQLLGVDGRVALDVKPGADAEHPLDVSGLRGGVYLVKVASSAGVRHARALIP
jgi:hypothetical protein